MVLSHKDPVVHCSVGAPLGELFQQSSGGIKALWSVVLGDRCTPRRPGSYRPTRIRLSSGNSHADGRIGPCSSVFQHPPTTL